MQILYLCIKIYVIGGIFHIICCITKETNYAQMQFSKY